MWLAREMQPLRAREEATTHAAVINQRAVETKNNPWMIQPPYTPKAMIQQ